MEEIKGLFAIVFAVAVMYYIAGGFDRFFPREKEKARKLARYDEALSLLDQTQALLALLRVHGDRAVVGGNWIIIEEARIFLASEPATSPATDGKGEA